MSQLKVMCVRALCTVVSVALALVPVHDAMVFASVMGAVGYGYASLALADQPSGASDGQNLGYSLLQGPSTDGTNVYFQGAQGTQSLSVNDLFQARGSADDVQAMENAYGDNDAASALSTQVNTRLRTENSTQAQAYLTVQSSAQTQAHPDLSNDPALAATQDILSPSDPIFLSLFGDCTQSTAPTGSGLSVHVQNLQYCESVATPPTQCELTHTYAVHVMDLVTGSGTTTSQSCGTGCLEIVMGKDEYADGTFIRDQQCGIFEQDYVWTINQAAIISATLEEVWYDDYGQVQINGTPVYAGPWGSFPTTAPPTACGSYGCNTPCENNRVWDFTPNTDITALLTAKAQATFSLRVNIGGNGEHTRIRMRVQYDPTKVVTSDNWDISPICQSFINALSDTACVVSGMNCLNGPAMNVQCITDQSGYQVCQNDFAPAPIAGFSPLCQDGVVTANCQFNAGAMQCWTDPSGVQHCPENDASQPDGCTSYESNSACGFVSSACLPFAEGKSGTCYAFDETWDCGYNVSTPAATATQVNCPGAVQCLGSSCVSPTQESNTEFSKAAATLSAMSFMAQDISCVNNDPGDCSVFGGTAMNCKIALGGVQNCCNEPVSVGLLQYLELAKATYDLAKKLQVAQWLADQGLDVPGAWNAVANFFRSTWDTITQPFTSAWGSMVQSFGDTDAGGIASFSLSDLEQNMMSATQEWVSDTFGSNVADVFFAQTTDEAGETITTLSDTFATALSVIMWVYTVYVIVTVLIGIAWPCSQSEFELAARKQMNLCDRVGTYCAEKSPFGCIETRQVFCCYNSPLARIVMEGARPQLGETLGTPTQPDCDGLTLDQLSQVNWNDIDLAQWYAIEVQTGLIPSTAAGYTSQYSLNTVTVDPDAQAPTPNAPERIQSEVQAAQYFDEAREKIREDLWSAQQ